MSPPSMGTHMFVEGKRLVWTLALRMLSCVPRTGGTGVTTASTLQRHQAGDLASFPIYCRLWTGALGSELSWTGIHEPSITQLSMATKVVRVATIYAEEFIAIFPWR